MDAVIRSIKRQIRVGLEDIHIVQNDTDITDSTQLYNEVNLALLEAELKINRAWHDHEMRREEHFKKYGNPRINVD